MQLTCFHFSPFLVLISSRLLACKAVAFVTKSGVRVVARPCCLCQGNGKKKHSADEADFKVHGAVITRKN